MSTSSLSGQRKVAQSKLAEYMSSAHGYSFNTYDRYPASDGPLTPEDVLMANLLSLRLGASNVIPLFIDGQGSYQELRQAMDHALVQLRDTPPYESFDDFSLLEDALASLLAANEATARVKWWTPVTVSKVLHRRRPQIVPLLDSRVREFYGVRRSSMIYPLLWQDIRENLDWLEELAASKLTPDGRPLSILRLADILIWMR